MWFNAELTTNRVGANVEVGMRKTLIALASVATLALGSTAANASALVLSPGVAAPGPNVTPPVSGTFGNSFNPATPGMFTDVFNFNLTGASLANGSLVSISLNGGNNIDFTCATCTVRLDSTAFTLMSSGAFDVFTLNPTNLALGPHAFTITGNITSGPSAAYTGTFNLNLPVPEASTWAMMLVGFGAIGFAMRGRRRTTVLAQVA
jgi:hypothetical protein